MRSIPSRLLLITFKYDTWLTMKFSDKARHRRSHLERKLDRYVIGIATTAIGITAIFTVLGVIFQVREYSSFSLNVSLIICWVDLFYWRKALVHWRTLLDWSICRVEFFLIFGGHFWLSPASVIYYVGHCPINSSTCHASTSILQYIWPPI